MASVRRAIAPAGLLLAALFLAGCPAQPKLAVSPLALVINADKNGSEIQIANLGGGTLNWTASESLPWLSLQSAGSGTKQGGGSVSGSLGTGIAGVTLVADRTGLASGSVSGDITVASNGGTQTVRVTMITGAGGALGVTTNSIDFGVSLKKVKFGIFNTGDEPITWTAEVANEYPWLSASPTSGTLQNSTSSQEIEVTVSRGEIAPNSYTGVLKIKSGGGNADVQVLMINPPVAASPEQLDFGVVSTTKTLPISVTNKSFDALNLTVGKNTAATWLSFGDAALALASKQTVSRNITVDAAGLAPGTYNGALFITNGPNDPAPISIGVTLKVTAFSISSKLLEFGQISDVTSLPLTLTNDGPSAVNWVGTVSDDAKAWLTISPENDNVPGDGTSRLLQVTVDPTHDVPGSYSGAFTITHDGITETITVTFQKPTPANLSVAPSTIDLGASKTDETLAIWNPGIGSVSWSIDTANFPAWLSLQPGAGTTQSGSVISATVSGDQTIVNTLHADRNAAPDDTTEFSFTFNVIATAGVDKAVPVTVLMKKPQIPHITVEGEGVDVTNVQFINFAVDEATQSFVVRNDGQGVLTWNVDISNKPAWVTSFEPASGNLNAGKQTIVKVTVDRATLNYLGAQQTFGIVSNDPQKPTVPLLVEVQVPKKVSIGTRPDTFAFGPTANADVLQVANTGDPDTEMKFQITASKEWLSVYPTEGTSIGTSGSLKDYRDFTLTIDRSLLDSAAASAKLTITAFQENDAGQREPIPGVEPKEVQVNVQAAQLTIETQLFPLLRPSSQVRLPMLLRNVRYQILPLSLTDAQGVADKIQIFENDTPLELTETYQQVKTGFGTRTYQATNIVLMLDYSGSMDAAAKSVDDAAISGAADPLQALYERVVSQLFDSLPAETHIALAIFSDRDPVNRLPLHFLFGTAAEPASERSQLFLSDRDALLARLQAVKVTDHGATELLQALEFAADTLVNNEYQRNKFLSDFAEMPALITISDGRITTPPTTLGNTITKLQLLGIRYYPIGWGKDVAASPLVQLSLATGGHYYSTRTVPTGQVDNFGTPLRKPVVSELENWSVDTGEPCDQSVARDFRSAIVTSYTTLDEETSAAISGRLTFNDPNDDVPADACGLEDQGVITGSFAELGVNLFSIRGDNHLGGISMRSRGIQPDGTAIVTARLESVPRNVSRITFDMSLVGADPLDITSIEIVPLPSDGVISSWTLSQNPDGTYTFEGPALPYGQFGDLFNVQVTGANPAGTFTINLDVTDPVIDRTDPETKYFTLPKFMVVGSGEAFAPALPTPKITTTPSYLEGNDYVYQFGLENGAKAYDALNSRTILAGTATTFIDVTIENIGGAHLPTDVALGWSISHNGADGSSIVLENPGVDEEGLLGDTGSKTTIRYKVDRTLDSFTYVGQLDFDFDANSITVGTRAIPVVVQWTVLPPALSVPAAPINLTPATTTAQVTVQNTGQGFLNWSVDIVSNPVPDWLTVGLLGSTVGAGDSATIDLTAATAGLASGTYTYNLIISGAGDTVTIPVTLTIP